MRIRATVAVASGALALSALAVPAAQAGQSHGERPALTLPTAAWLGDAAGKAAPSTAQNRSLAAAKAAAADPKVTKVVVNGGKPIVLGTSATKKVSVAITATDDSGIGGAAAVLWTGGSSIEDDSSYGFGLEDDTELKCKAASATTSTCTHTITVDPKVLYNTDAKTWNVYAVAVGNDESMTEKEKAGTVKFQRLSQLTVAATPKPVKKGKTLTVTGKLSRANWDTGKYAGYTVQPVKLQFRKSGTETYTTIKTVKTSNTGTLSTTTTKTTAEGYWRWSFAGTSTTPAVNAAGTLVKIKK
ncbi:DUF5707 domain-containing protein [Streptomyces sp. NPDC087850]|uniref:DUF5707 domain-containing protein n=1 Tax=Streptomyces sp. NPDC087850 TaxID=3365809 RepID=UPI0037F90037